MNTSSPGKFVHKIQKEEAIILAQRAIEEQERQRKENEVKNMEVRAYLMQPSSSESEDCDSNASNIPAGSLNTKKFHRRFMEALKGNFQSRATVYSQKNGGAEAAENENS